MIMGADRYGNVSFSPVIFLPHKPNDIQSKFNDGECLYGAFVKSTVPLAIFEKMDTSIASYERIEILELSHPVSVNHVHVLTVDVSFSY